MVASVIEEYHREHRDRQTTESSHVMHGIPFNRSHDYFRRVRCVLLGQVSQGNKQRGGYIIITPIPLLPIG